VISCWDSRRGIDSESTIRDYVVTPQLADDFDQALELIRSAVETNASRAAYLDGSFGSGKSHFMAVPGRRCRSGWLRVLLPRRNGARPLRSGRRLAEIGPFDLL
jgi:hypothetical protein